MRNVERPFNEKPKKWWKTRESEIICSAHQSLSMPISVHTKSDCMWNFSFKYAQIDRNGSKWAIWLVKMMCATAASGTHQISLLLLICAATSWHTIHASAMRHEWLEQRVRRNGSRNANETHIQLFYLGRGSIFNAHSLTSCTDPLLQHVAQRSMAQAFLIHLLDSAIVLLFPHCAIGSDCFYQTVKCSDE